ncbi:hypothetical protein HL033_00030 [Neoehrlichia mikurensis]|uniref:Uncharacterized protein n=1 Tax=Neoehrlichia mikurensis TaxID=89586 RepID=A0A9Q9F3F4_9RICK|nr:hypothetical protein [Neoehrlichia mikurensis]QXK91975.1 hypothetical protein IAH97_00030 [Neoehrlichia mikurensis]QXK92432.1 hypothetical protein HUN61_00030 [Neoehrlichia mikurensis]QXK93667.1 hypothetical protein HL033_00030 [Neoehrlichia mikurensis]UTO55370.1 hypothetical protein LUA82_04295 [Neoehrlichia mikurensis]UTO56290.1 hypothetical protein LUA81_04250 [Neoehrlichia mikurensis]
MTTQKLELCKVLLKNLIHDIYGFFFDSIKKIIIADSTKEELLGNVFIQDIVLDINNDQCSRLLDHIISDLTFFKDLAKEVDNKVIFINFQDVALEQRPLIIGHIFSVIINITSNYITFDKVQILFSYDSRFFKNKICQKGICLFLYDILTKFKNHIRELQADLSYVSDIFDKLKQYTNYKKSLSNCCNQDFRILVYVILAVLSGYCEIKVIKNQLSCNIPDNEQIQKKAMFFLRYILSTCDIYQDLINKIYMYHHKQIFHHVLYEGITKVLATNKHQQEIADKKKVNMHKFIVLNSAILILFNIQESLCVSFYSKNSDIKAEHKLNNTHIEPVTIKKKFKL